MNAWTSSAEPPSSAWMKLACLSDTCADPDRSAAQAELVDQRPGGHLAGHRVDEHRPGSSDRPAGCSRRHAHDLAISPRTRSRSPRASCNAASTTMSAADRGCCHGTAGRAPPPAGPPDDRGVRSSRDRRRRPRRARPPCRIRGRRRSSAPRRRPNPARRPPTRTRSRPRRRRRRASTGSATDAPARTTAARRRRSSNPSVTPASDTAIPANPASATSRFEPATDARARAARTRARRRQRRAEVVERRDLRRTTPPDHRPGRSSAAPIGTSNCASVAEHGGRRTSRLDARVSERVAYRTPCGAAGTPASSTSVGQASRCRRNPSRCTRRRAAPRRRRNARGPRGAAATPPAARGWASSTALTTSLPVTPGIGVVPEE